MFFEEPKKRLYMSDTTLFFIRHGEVTENDHIYGPSVPLNDTGIKQIEDLGQRIKQHDTTIDVFCTSPMTRAYSTALALGTIFDSPVQVLDDLSDIHAPGFIGMPLTIFQNQFHGVIYDYNLTDDQESYESLVSRARQVLQNILTDHKEEKIGIVSHGDLLMVMMYLVDHPNLLNDPEESVPDIVTIQELMTFYINKGEACRVTIKEDGTVSEKILYFRGEQSAPKKEF